MMKQFEWEYFIASDIDISGANFMTVLKKNEKSR